MVFHTGDWKSTIPVLGQPSSAAALTAIGDRGVLAMVCDSTNTFQETASGSESSVHPGLLEQVNKAKGRVLVTTFASNAARLETIGRVAVESGRQLCVAGRSLDRILKVARATGYLRDFPETVRFDEAMRLPRNEVLIVATGGQGEERAALRPRRIRPITNSSSPTATGDLLVEADPGNEVRHRRIMNALSALGVLTVTERQAQVHVSGHPGGRTGGEYGYMRPES